MQREEQGIQRFPATIDKTFATSTSRALMWQNRVACRHIILKERLTAEASAHG